MPGQDALVVYNWANIPEHIVAFVGLEFFEHRIFLVFLCYSCVQVRPSLPLPLPPSFISPTFPLSPSLSLPLSLSPSYTHSLSHSLFPPSLLVLSTSLSLTLLSLLSFSLAHYVCLTPTSLVLDKSVLAKSKFCQFFVGCWQLVRYACLEQSWTILELFFTDGGGVLFVVVRACTRIQTCACVFAFCFVSFPYVSGFWELKHCQNVLHGAVILPFIRILS